MTARLRRLLVLALLAWLPLHASAMPVLALHCVGGHDGHDAAIHADAGSPADAAVHAHGAGGHDGHTEHGASAEHFCCHHFSALPVSQFADAADREPVHVTALVPSPPKFFPEPQRRPPRA